MQPKVAFLFFIVCIAVLSGCKKQAACSDEEVFFNLHVNGLEDFMLLPSRSESPFLVGSRYYVDSGYACFEIADTTLGICGNELVTVMFDPWFTRTDNKITISQSAHSNAGAHKYFMDRVKVYNIQMTAGNEPFDMKGGDRLELYLTVRFISGGSFALDSARFQSAVNHISIYVFGNKPK